MTAAVLSAEIEERFQGVFLAAGKPVEMAVITSLESEGRLHCEVIAYFSPAEVEKDFDALPCPKPEKEGLGLLAGDVGAWLVLFQESAS